MVRLKEGSVLLVDELGGWVGGDFRIDEVSLEVRPGERLAVLGTNGSGKSSLLRLIAGLAVPDQGSIRWSDVLLSSAGRVHVAPERRSMGLVFQQGALFPHLDVRGNVALGLPLGVAAETARSAVDEALATARVARVDGCRVDQLSGGEQQRVALARALVRRPALLLLDEPFHSLDAPVSRAILAELRHTVERQQVAAVLVTHDIAEAAAFADLLLVLRDGRSVQSGSFQALYERPADREVAALLGPLETVEVQRARAAGLELPGADEVASVSFRPEHLALTPVAESEQGGLRVVEVRCHGGFVDVTVALDDDTELHSRRPAESVQTARGATPALLSPGDRVTGRVTQLVAIRSQKDSPP